MNLASLTEDLGTLAKGAIPICPSNPPTHQHTLTSHHVFPFETIFLNLLEVLLGSPKYKSILPPRRVLLCCQNCISQVKFPSAATAQSIHLTQKRSENSEGSNTENPFFLCSGHLKNSNTDNDFKSTN